MAVSMNIFRILGDVSHTASKCILIWAIHWNKSAEGISLLTQLLYILVFGTRYLDLFWVPPWWSWWNTVLKIFYIASSAYIVWVMMRVYARTREKEYAWKLATWTLAGCLVSAPLVCLIFRGWAGWTFSEILWTFSIELESVAVLPQLLLLRQTSVPTVLDSYYLVTLGSYRFFYILNWIVRAAQDEGSFPIRVMFGTIQTALYADFAWVYWTRQRVKLRGGSVVDSDDLRKGFLVRRIIGRGSRADGEDGDAEEEAGLQGAEQQNGSVSGARSWGARGISVSADDTLLEGERAVTDASSGYADRAAAADAQMIDPAHFEDDDDDDADAPPPPVAKDSPFKPPASRATQEADESATAWAQNTGEGGSSAK